MSENITTTQRLSEIAARVNKATPGPWIRCPIMGWAHIISEPTNKKVTGTYDLDEGGICSTEKDSDFIRHARQDIPFLLAEVERLREALRLISKHRELCRAYDADMGHPQRNFDESEVLEIELNAKYALEAQQ